MTSKNQQRKQRRRDLAELKTLRKLLRAAQNIALCESQMKEYYLLELNRERGLVPFPSMNTIAGLSYWVNRSIFGNV